MKRRVGAILVRNKRIVATGYIFILPARLCLSTCHLFYSYNGTPLGLKNCNEGGCARCNGLNERESCLCLHAEENALLEAGRERVSGATLYCNTSAQNFYFYMLLSVRLQMSMSYLYCENRANRCQGGGVQPEL